MQTVLMWVAFGFLNPWLFSPEGLAFAEAAAPDIELEETADLARGGRDICPFTARRMLDEPIITHEMDDRLEAEAWDLGYVNVNGPSLIRVPSFVKRPLGPYYLYFAHHRGKYIRLAHARRLTGPWRIHSPGVLDLEETGFPVLSRRERREREAEADWSDEWSEDGPDYDDDRDETAIANPHIASPDVIVDEEAREIRMYFHGALKNAQRTRVAISRDGLNFEVLEQNIAGPYLRVFKYRDRYYGIGRAGRLYRSRDGLSKFRVREKSLFDERTRHVALLRRGETLYVFSSRVGDRPERILCAEVDLSPESWKQWRATRSRVMLRPELAWEGADERKKSSRPGPSRRLRRELRDPAIYEENGRTYLLYSGGGEYAIGIAELVPDEG